MKSMIPTWAWLLVGVALVVSFGIDVSNSLKGGAVDFRNRITGARLFERGIDPYHYKWNESEPQEFCDFRNNPNLPVSKTTVTPTFLLLYLPLAALPYRIAQFTWLFFQWLMLLGLGWLWLRRSTTALTSWLVVLFIAGFSFTESWRWEAERGQDYLLLAFLFAYWMTTTMDSKRTSDFISGCVAGFLIALRPPFVLLVPFVALHRRGQLAGATVGLLVGCGVPLLISPAIWTDYSSAMQSFSYLYRNNINPSRLHVTFPPTVEGIPSDIAGNLMAFHTGNFSVHELLRWLGMEPFPELPPILLVAIPYLIWLWATRKQEAWQLLGGVAAWFFLADLFLPAIRFDYHDVFILDVVLAQIVVADKFPAAVWPCAVGVLSGWAVYVFWPTAPWLLNLPAFFFTLGAILCLFTFRQRSITSRQPFAASRAS
jgi:hypothetical protein